MGVFTPFSFLKQPKVSAVPDNPPYYANLVRWFDAEDAGASASSTWQDLSGNVDGTVGSEVTYTTGTPNYYEWSGPSTNTDHAVHCSPNPFTGTNEHTIIVWFRADSGNQNGVLSFVGATSSFQKITMRLSSTGNLRVEFEGAGDTTGLSYSANTWTQAAYSFSGPTPNDTVAYLNTSSETISASTTTLNISSTNFWWGVQTGFFPYDGRMGVCLAYDFAMSASQIEEVYEYYRDRYGV